MLQAARSGFTLESRRFYWPHAISFAPKATVVELQDIPAAAQRMYDRVSVLSGGTEEGFEDVRLSWDDESGMEEVQQVMRAVTSHFPVGEPWLLEPLVKHVARVLDNTAVCFYFFWYDIIIIIICCCCCCCCCCYCCLRRKQSFIDPLWFFTPYLLYCYYVCYV